MPMLPSLSLALTLLASPSTHPHHPLPDTTWLQAAAGNTNTITADPRYIQLLRAAFPQRQWFWFDHNQFVSVPELAQAFLGIPQDGTGTLESSRYLTIAGCVPHDCTDNGLLWIDTAPNPNPKATRLILAVDPLISGGSTSHLWLFTSSNAFDWQKPDANFRTALVHWLIPLAQGRFGSHPILITVVSPNGRQQDLAPSFLLPAESLPETPKGPAK